MDHELVSGDGRTIDEPQQRTKCDDHPTNEFDRRGDIAKMNVVRRITSVCHGRGFELLLVLSVLLLSAQLAWPSLIRWWRLPAPGIVGLDHFESHSMAPEHLIYLPIEYDRTQEWPLVVFLHGSGERGAEPNRLRNASPFRLKLPAIVAVPQCLPQITWQPADVAGLVKSLTARYRVNRGQVYLVGYSMGGFGAVDTAVAYPEMFAAVVPIAGGASSADVGKLRNVPLWAFHGAIDTVIPLTESERMVEAIRKAGGQPSLTIIADKGHGVCDDVCRRGDLWQWIFAQKCPH